MSKGSQIIYDTQKYLYNVTEDVTHSHTSVSQFFIALLPRDFLKIFFSNHCAPLKINTTDILYIHLFTTCISVFINKKSKAPPHVANFWFPGDNKTSITKSFLTIGKLSALRKNFFLFIF